ncbi:formyl transferase [Methylobacterium durans]|uniref:Formyl transferase n=1 Tax=Methylobacterium durans TaxID=2202825 RepID=A0A2U8W7E7_9HYPH|nr:formyl transferase [Methylobacterium durans]AWN42025.1 formyl transferase [Methylobacterium durans]
MMSREELFGEDGGNGTAGRAAEPGESVGAAPANGSPPRGRLVVRLDPNRIWRWHLWLLAEIDATGRYHVAVDLSPAGPPLPAGLRLLLDLERLVFRLRGEQAAEPLAAAAIRHAVPLARASDPSDLVLDLSGSASQVGGAVLRPLFDGAASENVLLERVMEPALLTLTIDGSARAEVARPEIAGRPVLTERLNNAFCTLLGLCLRALRDGPAPEAGGTAPSLRALGNSELTAFAARAAQAKVTRWLTKITRDAPRWRVGSRRARSEDLLARTLKFPADGYHLLPDDGRRFYADPFLLHAEGTTYVFVEEFPFDTQKGIISVGTLDEAGRISRLRPVLEEAHHLSYPHIVEHDGTAWMIPESCNSGQICLYRAVRLPDIWEKVAVLVDGLDASDATLHRQDGTWWMFAAIRERQGSRNDTLRLFTAPELRGPWTPAPREPALVDATSARPAGNLFRMDGKLWRPAQDCSRSYGGALSLCTVDRLSAEAYGQTRVTTIEPRTPLPGLGLHTLNFGQGCEVIDVVM